MNRLVPSLLVLAASTALSADWPIWRHDARRTGMAQGTSNITTPGIYWGSYVGGGLNGRYGLWALDVDGDGKAELLSVVGGRVVARNLLNAVVATSPALGLGGLLAIADVNGDGTQDLVAFSGNRTFILKGTDLSIEWAEPEADLGDFGGAVVGDITGDGRADLVIREGGCGARANGKSGFAYSFGATFTAALTPLWTFPQPECGNADLTLVNVDATPALEVFSHTGSAYQVRDGATGCLLAQSAAQPQAYLGQMSCQAGNVDAAAGEEIVCVADSGLLVTNAHAVLTLKYTPSASRCTVAGTLTVTQAKLAPDTTGALGLQSQPLVDLDEDGQPELVLSSRTDSTAPWTTSVLRASSPTTTLASQAGEYVLGWSRTGANGRPHLVTTNAGTLSGWRYDATPTPVLTREWTLAGHSAAIRYEAADSARFSISSRLVTLDFNGDGVEDLVTTTEGGNVVAVTSLVTPSLPAELRRFRLPADAEVQSTWLLPPVSTLGTQLAVTSNLGVLYVFDVQLKPTDFGGQDFKTGGFAGTGPRSYTAPDGGTSVFVVDSARGLRRVDAPASTNLFPAQPIWRRPNTMSGATITQTNGEVLLTSLGLVEPVTTPSQTAVRQLDFDGGTRWTSAPFPSSPGFDPAPVRLNTDTVPDFVVPWVGYPVDINARFRAFNGVDGGALWTDPYVYTPGCGGGITGFACADWNGDGIDDIVAQGLPGTGYLNGVNGQAASTGGGVTDCYFNPVLYDTDSNGSLEVILQSGYSPVKVLSHAFGVLYNTADDDRPYPNGGVAECPSGVRRFVQGSTLYPGALKVTTVNASYAFQKLYLAGGQAYSTQAAAKAAVPYVGYLGETSVHSNLSGQGHPTALVGSDEGFLYAINPCTNPPTLEYAVNLGAAVSEPIFGDTDGDGNDDIIVGTADGYLYGLRQRAMAPPAWVWDTDPPRTTSSDVDELDTQSTLSIKWAQVAGAVSYQVAVALQGRPLTSPEWTDVGNVTEYTFSNLQLQDAAFYVAGVRAVTPTGAVSPDTKSDGVRVWKKCAAVTCTAQDACHRVGTCDRATGACSQPLQPQGTTCPGGVCDVGTCRLNNGQVCTAHGQCTSQHCVDGVCCDTACDGACNACSVAAGAAVAGTCAPVVKGQVGAPSCSPYLCNGALPDCPTTCVTTADCVQGYSCEAGTCRAVHPNGQACTTNAQCSSGFCADGVCCDTACAGACDACAVAAGAAVDGTCAPVAAGSPGAPSCVPLVCDGVSAACPQPKGAGAKCGKDAECRSGFCTDGVCCDARCDGACAACSAAAGATADGVCSPVAAGQAGEPACAPLLCDGAALVCPSRCAKDADCVAGRVCDQGACVTPHRGYVGFGCGCGAGEGGPLGLLALGALLALRRRGGVR